MKLSFFVCIFFLTTTVLMAQEDCINGIDDDGDELIDVNDPECICCTDLAGDYVSNGNFNEATCCNLQDECYEPWDYMVPGTPIMFNDCFTGGGWPFLPSPLPAAAQGYVLLNTWPNTGTNTQEAIHQCLNSCLKANETYTLSYDWFGWLLFEEIPVNDNLETFQIYGLYECNGANTYSTMCPLSSEFELLYTHSAADTSTNAWMNISTSITPSNDIVALVVLSICNEDISIMNFITNISVTGDGSGTAEPPELSGGPCGNYTYTATNVPPGATIQWYINGVAVVGETGLTFVVEPGMEGEVSFGWTFGVQCEQSPKIPIPPFFELIVDVAPEDVSCFGQNNGSIELIPTSGIPDYTYTWSHGPTTSSVSDLAPGTYFVTVSDANSCSKEIEVVIEEPDQLIGSIVNVLLVDSTTGFGGATVEINGGFDPYTYLWDNGEITSTAFNLLAGTHTVEITDMNGCILILTVEIERKPLLIHVFTSNTCEENCFGNIDVAAQGGLLPYSINWDDVSLSGFNITGVCPGIYTFNLVDGYGDIIESEAIVEAHSKTTMSATVTNPSCTQQNSGSISISAAGEPPINYAWESGQTTESLFNLSAGVYAVTIGDGFGCSIDSSFTLFSQSPLSPLVDLIQNKCNGDSTASISINIGIDSLTSKIIWSDGVTSYQRNKLKAGTFYYSIEKQGCTYKDTLIIKDPSPIKSNVAIELITCPNANSGFLIIDTIGYFKQKISFNWENGSNAVSRIGLDTGLYVLFVRDSNNCQVVKSFNILSHPDFDFDLMVEQPNCNGGTNGSISIISQDSLKFLWQSGEKTESLSGLGVGNYTVMLTDTFGCSKDTTLSLSEKSSFAFESIIQHEKCFGEENGFIEIKKLNNVIATYLWSTGEETSTITGLPSGEYNVTITDENLCEIVRSFEIKEGKKINTSVDTSLINCFGEKSAFIDILSTDQLMYQWSHTNKNTSSISKLDAGMYSVTITDSLLCSQVLDFEVRDHEEIKFLKSSHVLVCIGDSAFVFVLPQDNLSNYSILWSNGKDDFSFKIMDKAEISFTLTDMNTHCSVMDEVNIDVAPQIQYSYSLSDTLCQNENSGEITLTGSQNYNYKWSDGSLSSSRFNLSAGLYAVTVTDPNTLCALTDSFILSERPSRKLDLLVVDETCFGYNDGKIIVKIDNVPYNGGLVINGIPSTTSTDFEPNTYTLSFIDETWCLKDTSIVIQSAKAILFDSIISQPTCYDISNGAIEVVLENPNLYIYSWNTGDNTSTIDSLSVGQYEVTITNEKSCEQILSFVLTSPNIINTSIKSTNVRCDDVNSGAIQVITQSSENLLFSLNDGSPQTNPFFDQLNSGSYVVKLLHDSDCIQIIDTINIEPAKPLFSISFEDIDTANLKIGGEREVNVMTNLSEEISSAILYVNGQEYCAVSNIDDCMPIDYVFQEENILVLSAVDANGCELHDTITIRLKKEEQEEVITIPNVITPSSDDSNNKWMVSIPSHYTLQSTIIVDRWGSIVYSTNQAPVEWLGTLNGIAVESGVYVYTLEVFNTKMNKLERFVGDVTVIW